MKTLIYATLAVALATPVVSFAQTAEPVTRAEVRADLVQLESAGYRPVSQDATYPSDIQAHEARVHAGNGSSAYGGVSDTGTSVSPVSSPAGNQ
ncbi:MAG: DUF4148 domain-containing protein [Pseudomonadota bacterium]|nr:DUF4148 domain-containing protein [Pseudomonadota bacterium]